MNPASSTNLIVSSRNPHKLAELERLLAPLAMNVRSAAEVGVPEVEETGTTYVANALLKASEAWRTTGGEWCLADDSGLSVDHLDGAPGVFSARFAGENVTYADNNALLLERMKGVAESDRGAAFNCTLVLLVPQDAPLASTDPAWERITGPGVPSGSTAYSIVGRVEGRITEQLAGAGGFGYDPLFFVQSEGITFAELSAERKNEISHRGRALADLCRCMGSIASR
jgi:XTP/dITP diphosphohydrolase